MNKPARWNAKRARKAIREGGLDNHLDIASDPEFAKHPEDPLAEPVIVDRFWKNRKHDAIIVSLSRYQGHVLVDVRMHAMDKSGKLVPTPKGLALKITRLPNLVRAIEKAHAKALDLDLIEAVS